MREIFDDLKSIIHFLLGLIVPIVPILNIIIILVFIVYQIKEDEILLYKIGDILEFILGFVTGVALKSTVLAIL